MRMKERHSKVELATFHVDKIGPSGSGCSFNGFQDAIRSVGAFGSNRYIQIKKFLISIITVMVFI